MTGRDRAALERRLGHRFVDRSWLDTACSHRSWAQLQDPPVDDYERLEFLGDALLGGYVAEWLWRDDPDAPEGVLTRRRQDVVRAETLAAAAVRLGLGDAVRLSPGEERAGGRGKRSILADLFEAVVAALYLDGADAKQFVFRALAPALEATRGRNTARRDWKTMFQERVQRRLKQTPTYRLVADEGPDHRKWFVAVAEVDGRTVGRGEGASRKDAEQQAARRALENEEPEHAS